MNRKGRDFFKKQEYSMINWENLVIEGGGSKNIASVGALSYLYENYKIEFESINNYAGSSSGSMIVVLLVLGYTPKEISMIITSKDLNKQLKSNWIGYPLNFLSLFGLNTRTGFVKFMSKLFKDKNFDPNITFIQLYTITKKTLVITGTNITKRKVVYFNHIHFPNLSVMDAIQASINIPYYFTRFKLDSDYYIDGGILDNFPLYYFDKYKNKSVLCKDSQHLYEEFPKDKKRERCNNDTLGILTIDYDYTSENEYKKEMTISSLYDYTTATINTLLHHIEKLNIHEDAWNRVIAIHLPYYIDSTDFSPPMNVIKELMEIGYSTASEYCKMTMTKLD
jgi:NTE family protein